MRPTILVTFTLSLAFILACGGPHTDVVEPGVASHAEDHYVRNIDLTTTRGEVGRPFSTEITWEDNYLTAVELTASGLPPGLVLDPDRRVIAGTPTQAGFFTIELAVRKRVERGRLHKPQPDERWWPARVQVDIYAPLGK